MNPDIPTLCVRIVQSRDPHVRFFILLWQGLVMNLKYVVITHQGFTGTGIITDALMRLPHVIKSIPAMLADGTFCIMVAVDNPLAWRLTEPYVVGNLRQVLNFPQATAETVTYAVG